MDKRFIYGKDRHSQENEPNTLVGIPLKIPARLNAAQTAKILGFSEYDIPILIAAKMLEPLGKPVLNATKYFATCEIETFSQNPEWLWDATQIIYDYWKGKNARKAAN